MKQPFLILLLFLSLHSFSQAETETVNNSSLPTTVVSVYTHGYINGKRLDSIDATFAEFGWRNAEQVTFDYGQQTVKNKSYLLTDNNGLPLIFTIHSNAFLLNFFHYNHWDFVNTYNINTIAYWILKKQ